MKKFAIHVTDKKSGSVEKVVAEIEDEEITKLEGYLANMERLSKSKIVSEGIPGTLTIKADIAGNFTHSVSLPDEDQILAFLHRMRRFILNDESSSYNTITGIIGRRFNNEKIRSMIKTQRKIYDGREFQSVIQIQSNGQMINSEKMLFDWLNSFEYHDDSTKRKEIEKLHKLMPLEASRAVFLMLLMDKVKAIFSIGDFVALILGKVETIETRA